NWCGNRFGELEDEAVKQRLQGWLHQALKPVYDRDSNEVRLAPFESNPATVNGALETIRAFTHLPITTIPPCWLGETGVPPPPAEILPLRSTLLHLPTMQSLRPTPAFFTRSALEVDHDVNAPVPMGWLRFLHELFDGDQESF